MGAPGWTSFCKNGHIVEVCSHGHIHMEELNECDFCGAPVIGSQTEWPDEDYAPFDVPERPIGNDKMTVTTTSKYGTKQIERSVAIFDVSKILKRKST